VSSVGLIPSILGGLDIDLFLKELQRAYDIFMDLSVPGDNPALLFALFLKSAFKKGYRNVFSMPYHSFLEGITGLFVQQISESTGKRGLGLLGTMQAAPICQHSVLEYLLGGTKGHTIPIIWNCEKTKMDYALDNPYFDLSGISASQVISHQADATFQALLTQKVPAAKIQVAKNELSNFSTLIAFIQSTVYMLCMLFNVNWESNPLVNLGKEICNEAIKEGKTPEQRLETRRSIAEGWTF
jgi:glucose-6-phosphate isomerase